MTGLSTHLNDRELWKIDKDEVAYYGHMVLNGSLEKLIDNTWTFRGFNIVVLDNNYNKLVHKTYDTFSDHSAGLNMYRFIKNI